MKTDELKGQLFECDVDALDLDPENPRLPEELAGKPPAALLRYYYDNLVLEELAQSFIDNGFFMHEPLIVTPLRGTKRYRVLEGNRRLAALMILLGRPEAEGLSFDVGASAEALDRLRRVPCYQV